MKRLARVFSLTALLALGGACVTGVREPNRTEDVEIARLQCQVLHLRAMLFSFRKHEDVRAILDEPLSDDERIDPWGNEYRIDARRRYVASNGPDGKPGTDDDIAYGRLGSYSARFLSVSELKR